jgi:YHS domain-containing protein
MSRLSQKQVSLAIAGSVLLGGLVSFGIGARPSAADVGRGGDGSGRAGSGQSGQSGKSCMAEDSVESFDQLIKDVDDARQSGDVNRMRSALDEARKPLSQLRDCLDQARRPPARVPVATAAKDLGVLCGYEIDETRAPKAVYQQVTYYFCTENDRADFERQPGKYLKTTPQR